MKIPALAWSCFSIAQGSFMLISLHSNKSSTWRVHTVGNVWGKAGKHRKGRFLSHPVHLSRISLKCLFPCIYRHQNPTIAPTLPTRSMFTERQTWVLSKNLVLDQTPPYPHPLLHTSCLGMELWGRLEADIYIYIVVGKTEAIWGGIFNPKNEWIPLVREVQLRPWM